MGSGGSLVRPNLVKVARIGLAAVILVAAARAQTNIQARRAGQFIGSMGVNVHLESQSAPYREYSLINQRLQELGMRHIRDEINDTDLSFVNEIQSVGELGYSLCGLIEGGNDYPPQGRKLHAAAVVPMIRDLKPVIEAVEGPNEPDDGGFVYHGVPYPQGAIDESEDLWNIVKSNAEISDLPVIALSEGSAPDFALLAQITPPPIDYANFGNMHAYQGGLVGDHGLSQYMKYSRELTGNDPLWTTEMGYHNNTQYLSDNEQQGVSPRASAIYLPIAFLEGFERGVERTFSYELIDESNDPGLTSGSGEGHYGLLNYDGSPKPAFTALKNLIEILTDPGAQPFELGSLGISFINAPPAMEYTLLEKSNGDYYLALWNDVIVYQLATANAAGEDIYRPNVPVTVVFASPQNFTVYAPNDASGANPTQAYTISSTPASIQVDLPAKVLLIKISSDFSPPAVQSN